MIITLHLSTGAYSSWRKLDITIANRSSCPLRSFSRRSIHPFNLALSFLPLLFSSLYSPFSGLPSILPFLPSHITHDRLPFPPKCQQMQMFIILVNTFDNSCEQLQGLQKRRMKLHLATELPSWRVWVCFLQKKSCLILSLSFFHQKRLVNWIFSKQVDVLYTSF